MTAILDWCLSHPLLVLAALFLLFAPMADWFERDAGMDTGDDLERRIAGYFAEPEAIAARIHAQMVADGLIRNPNAHTRLGDAP